MHTYLSYSDIDLNGDENRLFDDDDYRRVRGGQIDRELKRSYLLSL